MIDFGCLLGCILNLSCFLWLGGAKFNLLVAVFCGLVFVWRPK